MKQSLFWKITHWLGGGNIGAAQRAFRKRQRAYLDAHKKDKMSCEYMATLELDDLLDIQSKHSEGTPIYLRVQFELQRRFNQDQISAVDRSTWLIITATLLGAAMGVIGTISSQFLTIFLQKFN
jgi:hypothetical protein